MWPSPPRLSLSISSVVSPAAMVVLTRSAVLRVREKTTLARGVHDAGERVVGRRQGSGHALVSGAAHDVRVRALVNADLLLQVCRVDGQAEAELPVLGALVGEKAV
jgi:hypothetical protein